MSVAVMLQALGWVSVLWLVTIHLLIQRGRLAQTGRAYRIAGCAAAASVVAASAAEEIWPVAVLGLLWLRIEVFGHRAHVPECRPEFQDGPGDQGADPDFGRPHLGGPDHDSAPEPENLPTLLVGALTRQKQRPIISRSQSVLSGSPESSVPSGSAAPTVAGPLTVPPAKGSPVPKPRPTSGSERPQRHLHAPHIPHPHLGRRTVDRVFKVEMGIVIVIALVFFVIWAEQQRASFTRNADYVVCNWIDGC
jgi:hypothetical protein